ncbi:hypothetical protein B5X24_HaOG204056 [Helicoverpa armigera]|uniref:F-box domain-containing protein n=1 Tax=Helicoverpa armigera TaxID=29058 RepID=A0A2W1BTA3_HELAM|nr:hypothetical protein B5X24_HaOG204056 [Helicoverpa armigera]
MSLTWSTLPLLPLRCILHHLSTEDAMAAMSTCRHWRSALYMYEGRKELLKLKAKYLEQCMFLTRVFKKHVKKLHIYLDCNEPEIDKFMTYVLMQYFDTVKLQELVFIGPSYVQQSMHLPFIKLRRMLIETLVFKNVKCIKKLSFMGCGMAAVRNDNERYSHKALELYARPLKFCSVQTAADTVLSSVNQQLMQISSLTHVAVDYEQISTVALQTLSKLPHFRFLTLNITNRRFTLRPIDWDILHDYYRCQLRVAINITLSKLPHFRFLTLNITNRRFTLRPIDWDILHDYYRCQLRVAINIIGVPFRRFDSIIDNPDTYTHVNPFVLLCWQCMHLQRLVIHGYWIWQYDVLGFVRLRKGLIHLEISAIYSQQDTFNSSVLMSEEGTVRVLSDTNKA